MTHFKETLKHINMFIFWCHARKLRVSWKERTKNDEVLIIEVNMRTYKRTFIKKILYWTHLEKVKWQINQTVLEGGKSDKERKNGGRPMKKWINNFKSWHRRPKLSGWQRAG